MPSNKIIIGVVLALFGLFLIYRFYPTQSPVAAVTDPSLLAGIQVTESPWIPEIAHLRDRLDALKLPALTKEGTALHIHQHLDIFINGKPLPVPANIGVNQAAGFISTIHTHDAAGIIHVESPKVALFTLGQFFDIWGVRFTTDCIGGMCTAGERTLKVYVNGALVTDDPRSLVLAAHQEIVVAFGKESELPQPIPASFNFPAGD